MTGWIITAMLIATAPAAVRGVVRDSSGAAVPGAAVIVRGGGTERQVLTGPGGRFTVEPPSGGELTLIIRAGGFAEQSRNLSEADRAGEIEIVLSPAPILETVTVTPARTERAAGNVPASVHVLGSDEIRQSPAVVADDVLRQIPTFSLFRRTSSLSSHPTAQGVSLRGIGPSGVSRTLVLVDGVPFNDPFGGWVYWTRVPLESVDRIEIVDGSSSSLYGSFAMGGVINIVSRRPTRRTIELKPQLGSRGTRKADFLASDVWGNVAAAVDASWFRTGGFPIVRAGERGLIDNNATARFVNVSARLDYSPSDRVRAFVRGGRFREERGNGKILEVNDTTWTAVSGGIQVALPDGSSLQASLFGDFERFHSTFLAITPPSSTVAARSIVRLTTDQRVPTSAAGGMLQWSRAVGQAQHVSAGADWRRVDGDSEEDVYNAAPGPVTPPVQQGVPALRRVSGGTQRSVGVFVQDILVPLPNLTLTLGARADHWRNYDAHNFETNVPSGQPTTNDRLLPDASRTIVSPRAAALYRVSDRLGVWGAVGGGFRAPTLNELYRQFRVGTVLTLANERLGPERLVGVEAGLTVSPARNVTVRSTWFDNRVENPVSNVTISAAGANVVQQRQNLGRTRIRGLQTDAEFRVGSTWKVSGGYLFNRATVSAFDANPALVGRLLPQVPRHRGSVRVAYANAKHLTAALGVQFIGAQFDDDLNARAVPGRSQPGLPGYAVADVTLSRAVRPSLDVFFGVQNLFDREYIVGTLPTTVGSPRQVNGGLRIHFAGR